MKFFNEKSRFNRRPHFEIAVALSASGLVGNRKRSSRTIVKDSEKEQPKIVGPHNCLFSMIFDFLKLLMI